jgi:hypothetical protein
MQQALYQVKLKDYETPTNILEKFGNVATGKDIFFINLMSFWITISRNIKFCTCKMIKNAKSNTILLFIKPVLRLYKSRGFKVRFLLMDGHLESIRKDIRDINVIANIIACDNMLLKLKG